MATEFFVVPLVLDTSGFRPITVPKYAVDPAVTTYGCIRYSRDTTCLVMMDATQAHCDSVEAQADADRIAVLGELNDNIGGQNNNRIRGVLEDLNIPGNWVSAADSYRQVLRGIIGMFLFSQRHEGLNGSGFFTDLEAAGFGLNTQWGNLSQAFRDTMQATIDDYGFSIAPSNNNQVRAILKDFSDEWDGKEFFIANVEI